MYQGSEECGVVSNKALVPQPRSPQQETETAGERGPQMRGILSPTSLQVTPHTGDSSFSWRAKSNACRLDKPRTDENGMPEKARSPLGR